MAACESEPAPPTPSDLAISPADGPDQLPTKVVISGRSLVALVKIDFSNSARSSVDTTMTVKLGSTGLLDASNPNGPAGKVHLTAKNTISAIVPAGMTIGDYDLSITDGIGRTVTLKSGYKVRATVCSDGDAGGAACGDTCAHVSGCGCADSNTCSAVCGDGIVRDDEQCDDGNRISGDGCSSSCTLEMGWSCPTPGMPCTPNLSCGDGSITKPFEQCDDGNTRSGDGCSSACRIEGGFTCTSTPSVCTAICGDGQIKGTEQCDDGNMIGGDGCSSTCRIERGFTCTSTPSVCRAVCGDGIIAGSEQCDDGNRVAHDGCAPNCQLELGWTCTGTPSRCSPTCGDGMIVGNEQCDDHNTMSGDGCSSACQVEPGYSCNGMPSVCRATCGNGRIDPGEQCDDGNTANGDGCSGICQVEMGWRCSGMPSMCTGICGDGVIETGETCDDGNMIAGDGCSATCQVETGNTCVRQPSFCFLDAQIAHVDAGAVCPGLGTIAQPYCTIAAGIASTSPVVLVRTGTYAETLTVAARSVTLVGDRGVVLTSTRTSSSALTIASGSNATVIGVEVLGGATRVLVMSSRASLVQVRLGPLSGPGASGLGLATVGSATVSIDRSYVSHNLGGGLVLGASGPYTITNVVVVHNGQSAVSAVGGVQIASSSPTSRFANVTVADNRAAASIGGAGVRCDVAAGHVVNSIVYANADEVGSSGVSSMCVVTYSDVSPPIGGAGNIMMDPLFIDASYHISPTSPAVNAGDPSGVEPSGPAPALDIDSEHRPRGSAVDMGADEAA
jgi:cysteine-rich repeat protein